MNGKGDGNTTPDWQVVDATHLMLRAERAGNSRSGRIYRVTVTCTDTLGQSARTIVGVKVLHDQRQG